MSLDNNLRVLAVNRVLPLWIEIVLGFVFLSFGLLSLYAFKHTNNKIKRYQQNQLKEFRIKNPRQKKLSYREAGLRVPISKLAYQYLPIFLAIVFLGISGGFFFGFDNNFRSYEDRYSSILISLTL